MKINYNYLPEQFKNTNEIFKKWKKLIKSTNYTLGPFVNEFEINFAKFLGVKYCISTNTGTDALFLALKSLNISNGDEVITVCNTFYSTASSIVSVGAKPVFVDSDLSYQINKNKIEEKINSKTKAIIPVHWGGGSPDMKFIVNLAKKYKLKIIEDACQGLGAKINGKRPGTFGDLGAFSFHPLKSLNVIGDGGAIVTNNKKVADWLKNYNDF